MTISTIGLTMHNGRGAEHCVIGQGMQHQLMLQAPEVMQIITGACLHVVHVIYSTCSKA